MKFGSISHPPFETRYSVIKATQRQLIYGAPVQAFLSSTAILFLCSCARHIEAPRQGLSNIGADQSTMIANAGPGEKFDPAADEIISKESLKAWRHALAHDDQGQLGEAEWKQVRKHDEEESMQMLRSLSERFPTVSYLKTMMGQVKQHFGETEEAAKYYEESLLQNRPDPILIFKAAEMRRKQGDNQRALTYYRQVQKLKPDFPGAKLGEALCLFADEKKAAEGQKLLQDIVESDPNSKAAKEALEKWLKSRVGKRVNHDNE